jgi:hypothetical protein
MDSRFFFVCFAFFFFFFFGIWLFLAEFGHGPVLRGLTTDDGEVKADLSRVGEKVNVGFETKKLQFSGSARLQSADGSEEGAQYLVGVVNAKKRTINVLPVESGVVVPLQYQVRGYEAVQPEDHSDVNRGTYVREFASHREHKRLKNFMDAYVRGEHVVIADNMEKVRLTAKDGMEEFYENRTDYVPLFNAQTTVVQEVYALDNVVEYNLQMALLKLMEARFNEGEEFVEGTGPLCDANNVKDLCETVEPKMQAFFEAGLTRLIDLEVRKERRDHLVAMGFVLAASCYLLNKHPSRDERGMEKSTLFDDQGMMFDRVCGLLNQKFAAKPAGSKHYTMGQSDRIRVLNYASVAMMLCTPTREVVLKQLQSVFGLVSGNAIKHCLSVGMRPSSRSLSGEKSVAVYRMVAPIKIPTRSIMHKPRAFSDKADDMKGRTGPLIAFDLGKTPKDVDLVDDDAAKPANPKKLKN